MAYFVICMIIDMVVLVCFGMMGLSGGAGGSDRILLSSLLVTAAVMLSISLTCAIRRGGKKRMHLIRNSLLMKLSAFFLCMSFGFLSFTDGIYAFCVFLFIGIIFAVVTVAVVKAKKPARPATGVKVTQPEYSFQYRGKWEWDAAANEYMRLHGISGLQELTEEQNDKIYDYTATPFSYFFYWLAMSGFLSDNFSSEIYNETGETDAVRDMRERRRTPVEVIGGNLDHYFSEDLLLPGIIPFFRAYYDTNDLFTRDEAYLYDYLEANGNPDDRFYCMDFSWDICERLAQKIEEQYEKWNRDLYRNSNRDCFYDDELLDKKVHSKRYDTDLDVYMTGYKYNGFPGNPYGYLNRCLEALDSLSPAQIRRLERLFEISYGDGYDKDSSGFSLNTIYIMEPRVEGDVIFIVSGDADFEQEHGISFTIRNGIVVDIGYSYDFEDPYSTENEEHYLLSSGSDFSQIKDDEQAQKYVEAGELVRTRLLPDIPGCIAPSEEGFIYITPRALARKEKLGKHIRSIITYAQSQGITDLAFSFHPLYSNTREGIRESVVPRDLYIRTTEKKAVNASFHLSIWY